VTPSTPSSRSLDQLHVELVVDVVLHGDGEDALVDESAQRSPWMSRCSSVRSKSMRASLEARCAFAVAKNASSLGRTSWLTITAAGALH